MRSPWSALQRTLIIAGCALLLPVIIVLVLLARDQFKAREAAAESEALSVARQMVVQADARLAGDMQVMRVVGLSPALRANDLAAFRERVEAVIETDPGWIAIQVSDVSTGAALFDSRSSEPDKGDPVPILAGLTPRGAVGGVTRDGAGCPCVLLQMPVPGRSTLVMTVWLDPMIFQRMAMQLVPADAVTAVVDRAGSFVTRSTDFIERVGTPATGYVRDAAAAGGEGFYEGRTYEGLENLTAYSTSELSGWSAHVAIERGLVARPRTWAAVWGLLGSIVALLVAGVMIAYAFKDLAVRRREEARMIEMQKSEAVGMFTSTVVHDFNNLLAVFQASLNLIERGTAEPGTREKVALAREAIGRGARLTNQLLSFARGSDVTGEIGPVDLGTLIPNIEDMLRKLLGPRIELVVRIAPEARRVLANEDQLELALVNLAANARDAVSGAGRVSISAERRGGTVVLRFADTGKGIPPELLTDVFRPLFTTKPPGLGTGLGLAQVAGAIHQAGGSVEAANAEGGGAEFRITLRLALPDEVEPTAA